MLDPTANRFPHTEFPTGWFAVAGSHEIKAGTVKPIHNFGQDLVLFRTESGQAVVTDPYCPHLGAHLGYGGTVDGEEIRCPFHHWKFDANGRCTSVPFAPTPGRAKLTVWPTAEHNGLILVWYDLHGRPPTWEMPDFEPTTVPELEGFATYDGIKTYPQEILENGADWLHFNTVHQTRQLVGETEERSEGAHTLVFVFRSKDYETDIAPDHFKGEVTFYGPGYGRNLSWGRPFPDMTVENSVYVTPVDHGTLQIRSLHRIVPHANNQVPVEGLKQIFAGLGPEIKRQLEQDVVIWEKKAYFPQPMLAASDGPILKYRKWYSQFYPDNPANEGALGKVA
ncbi:MAG TPA: Rieske 2Fe-2S domain-containing protein [Alphaproteobacteria bacterium]|jgi:phenylpropionate dioxygenase-like ring-hydroxylating dioxygenase large terminal subunit|nr:Rieske 2Fe-2S domain-containing protein [Alphaproteobacteria bacterium]